MELKQSIMQLTPVEEQSAVAELMEDYENGDLEEFYEKYPELVGGYDDVQTFLEESRDGVVNLGTILVWYLVERGRLLLVNWEGEEEENLLAEYLNYRLEMLGEDFQVETESFYQWAESQVFEEPEEESKIWELFQVVDRQLRKHGYCLLGFDTLCEPDNIYVSVFPLRQASALLAADIQDIEIVAAENF